MALREAGVRLTLQGASEYRAGLKGIAQEMRTMATQSKLAVAQLGNNASITDTYSTKMKSLGTQLQVSGQRVDTLRGQQEKLNKTYADLPKRVNDVNRAYKDSVKETDRLENNYKQMSKALGDNHEETIKAKQAWEDSKTATSNLKTEHKELADELKRTEKELGKLPNELAKAELASQNLRNETEKLHEEYRKAGGRLADTAQHWRQSGEQLQHLGGRIQTAGGLITGFGSALTRGVTVPLVGLSALAIKASMDWESAFAGVMKTNDEIYDSNGQLIYGYEQLESELRNLTQTIPIAHGELAGIAENAGQLGIATQDVVGFTEVIAKLGHTTNLSYDEASTALAQFLNVTGSGTDTVSNLASAIVALGNNTAATEKDILMMSQRWATTGAMIGLTDAEIVGLSASLISMGVNVEAGGSALQRFGQKVNSHVLNSGEELSLMAQTAGMTATEFATAWNDKPMTAIEAFMKGLDGVVDSGGNANKLLKELGITSVNEVNALLALAGGHELLAEAIGLSSDAYAENTALGDEFAVFAETTASQLEILKNKINDVAIEFGGPLAKALSSGLDAIEPWLDKLADMARAFSEMDEEGQRNVLMWAGIAAAAGPVISIFGSLVTGIGGVVSGFGTMKTLVADVVQWFGRITTPKGIDDTIEALGRVPNSATRAGGAATFFSNPWVIAAGVALGAVTGFVMYMNNEANKPFKAHDEAVKATGGAYQDWFDAMLDGQATIEAFNQAAQQSANESTKNYQDLANEIRMTNLEVQEFMDTLTEGETPLLGELFHVLEVDGQKVSFVVESLTDKLRELGRTDTEIETLTGAVQDYGTMITNSFMRIAQDYQDGIVMTEEWANAHIQVVKDVATETAERYEEMRQAELDYNRERQQNLGETEAWLTEQNAITNAKYDEQIQIVDNAFATIQSILANAKDETGNWRQLTEQEVVSLLQAYQNLAEGTGQSLHEMDAVGQLIGSNMSSMVSTMGLDFLKGAGLIDQATVDMVASASTAEEKIAILGEALKDYDFIEVEGKDISVEVSGAEDLMEITDLISTWNDLTLEEKIAQVQGRGGDELQQLITSLGVDWESLTPEQKEAIVNSSGGEQVEETLYVLGIWKDLTLEEKQAILTAQIDSEAILGAIDARDLWNNAEFIGQLATIDTNAPDAQQQIVDLINEWSAILGLPPAQIETSTNAPETSGDVQELIGVVSELPANVDSHINVHAGGLSPATSQARDFTDATDAMPTEKSSTVTTNIISMLANTLAIGLYNAAVSAMQDKSSTATTSAPGLPSDTDLIKDYNTASGAMKNTSSTATTSTPGLPLNTTLVNAWNAAVNATINKSSTLTTSAPGIAGNTLLAWGWISALNSSYSKTSTLTTVYRTIGSPAARFAEGGHIDAFADGGEVKWGGGFASGAQNVPKHYMGIVGEAGPELFHVTKDGVSITPLSPSEKMEGVEGAFARYMDKKGYDGSGGTTINVEINYPVIKEGQDIKKISKEVGKEIARQMEREKITRKGSAVGFARG